MVSSLQAKHQTPRGHEKGFSQTADDGFDHLPHNKSKIENRQTPRTITADTSPLAGTTLVMQCQHVMQPSHDSHAGAT